MNIAVRRALTVGCWLLAVPCAGWALARLLGLERGFPAVQLMAFTPYVAVGAVVAAATALVARRWAAGAVAVVAAVSLCVVVVPRAVPDGGRTPAGPTLRVLTANLLAGGADERAVMALVRELSVDVLALQEFTTSDASGLVAAGALDVLPYQALYPRAGTVGSAVLSRYPLRDMAGKLNRGGFMQARATVEVPGAGGVEVESVHPAAPSARSSMPTWQRDLADQRPATVDGPVRVLLGDFNATLDHVALREIIDTGYRDAAAVVGTGFRPTWPYDEKWFIPGVALDHVLADRRVGVRAARPYRIPGSDHRAVYAELTLPNG